MKMNDCGCAKTHRPLKPRAVAVKAAPPEPQWPSFPGGATYLGTSPSGKVSVWYDPATGSQGQANAQALLAAADSIVQYDSSIFGTPDGAVSVILYAFIDPNTQQPITDGTGGADHGGCDFQTGQNIEVCVAYGRDDRVQALFEAELSECQMQGNLCGVSTGEALSRWCANTLQPKALADFASAPTWQQDGYPNWVDKTQPTDGDYPSIGCGMAFLSWLQARGYTLAQIAQAMVSLGSSGTLAQVWNKLTGQSGSPWSTFLAAAQALGTITSDDPFGGSSPRPPPPPPPPSQPTACELEVQALEAAIAKLKDHPLIQAYLEQLLARVQAQCGG